MNTRESIAALVLVWIIGVLPGMFVGAVLWEVVSAKAARGRAGLT